MSRRILLLGAAVASIAFAGCGSNDDNSSTASSAPATTPSTGTATLAAIPDAIKSKGTLTVAADATYAPNEFIGTDGKTVQGMDADLANALAGVLGIKVKVVNATFDGIIPGLASGKYDL